jgi:AraC family transcriptional regulator
VGGEYRNYADFCFGGYFADRPQEHRTIGSIPLSLTKIDYPAHEVPDPATDNFILCLSLRGTVNAAFRFGDRWVRDVLRPGMFAPVTPPNTVGELRMDAPHRHLVISPPHEAMRSAAGDEANLNDPAELGHLHDRGFRDPFLQQLCLTLWDEARQGNPLGPMFGDCARLALAAGLLRRSGKTRNVVRPVRKFSPLEMKRVAAYIDAQIDRPISVGELAAFVGLSEQRFIRTLRAATGLSPHQYLIARRIEAAKRRLMDPAQTLAGIAVAVGFADQAHMTATFSRLLGYTPGAWRKGRLG